MSEETLFPEATVAVTEYLVAPIPLDHPDWETGASAWAITVEWRGTDRWAVILRSRCLNRDGRWEYEPIPSERDDDFLARCRFDRDTALDLARQALPKVKVNGMTWTAAVRRLG